MGVRDLSSSRFSIANIINLVLRFLQLVFALAVVGLYAQDLNKARKEDKYSDGKWVCSSQPLRSQSQLLTPSFPGLRYRCRLPLRGHGSDIHDPPNPHLIHDHSDSLRLGRHPLHSLVRRVRPLRIDVHSREPGDGLRHTKDEECSLGGPSVPALVVHYQCHWSYLVH
jgi:hypothetical protein